MRIVVEVGDWEHECCGPAYELDAVIDITCLVVPPQDDGPTHFVESHHGLTTGHNTLEVHGRVAEICIEHIDGSCDRIQRLPSGEALRGFDHQDDGHLEQASTGEPVSND